MCRLRVFLCEVIFLVLRCSFMFLACWIVAQFLAPKPVKFALLTGSFIVLFSILKLWSWMQRGANWTRCLIIYVSLSAWNRVHYPIHSRYFTFVFCPKQGQVIRTINETPEPKLVSSVKLFAPNPPPPPDPNPCSLAFVLLSYDGFHSHG